MARAVVLGATGHIGAHIVRALLAEGHMVRAVYRNERYLGVLDGLDVERRRADLAEDSALARVLQDADWVFHAAGYYPCRRQSRQSAEAPGEASSSRSQAAVRQGIESTRRILRGLFEANPRRVVFTSSTATLRSVPGRAVNEQDSEPWPLTTRRNLYATVKIAMEQEVRKACESGLPAVIVNPSVCIGEYDAHLLSGRVVLTFAKYRIPWTLETVFNVVYTGDVGVGHVRAAERGRLGERYILAGENLRLKEFADLVCRQAGIRPPPWELPFPAAMAAAFASEGIAWATRTEPLFTRGDVRRMRQGFRLDGSKAVQQLRIPQTPAREAVRRAVTWFRKEGIL